MYSYLDIVKKAYSKGGTEKVMWQSVQRISDMLEGLKEDPAHKDFVEDFLLKEKVEMFGGHYNEEMAYKVVGNMKPAILIKEDKIVNVSDLNAYMKDMGLTPKVVYDTVKEQEKAVIATFAEKGMKVPLIPEDYTVFDFYVCMAEKLDHNWNTINGDMAKGAMLVYEALSDHDGGTRKVWDNTKHYLEY